MRARCLVIPVVLVVLAPSLCAGQDCVRFQDHLRWVGAFDTPGYARGVTAPAGADLVFLADGTYGLAILQVDESGASQLSGFVDTPGTAYGVAVSGGHAYVADGEAGLQIVNVADPGSPVLVGAWNSPGFAESVAVVESLALVADQWTGLHLVDVGDPAHPALLRTIDTPGYAHDVVVVDSFAYVADGYSSGLLVVDVSDPLTATIRGSVQTSDDAMGVDVAGGIAYVANDGGLAIIDVSDPASPQVLGQVSTPGEALRVRVRGNLAYVADNSSDVAVIDVGTPSAPQYLARMPLRDDTKSVALRDGRLFAGCAIAGGLQIVDLGDGAPASRLGSLQLPGYAPRLAVADSIICASVQAALIVVDVSDATAPEVVGTWTGVQEVLGVAVSGDFAYVTAVYPHQLRVIDISSSAHPVSRGWCELPGVTSWGTDDFGVAAAGGYAYVAGATAGLFVVEASDPENPHVVATLDTPGEATDIAISGSFAYLADRAGGLRVFDVRDPSSVSPVAAVDDLQDAHDVAVDGDYAYVATGTGLLRVVDISDPTAPRLVDAAVTCPSSANQVEISGRYVYVTSGGYLVVVDVAAPVLPVLLAAAVLPPSAGSLCVVQGRFGAVSGGFTLQTLPLECGGNVGVFLAAFSTSVEAGDVTIRWRVTERIEPSRLRLLAIEAGPVREIPALSPDGISFQALDENPTPGADGTVTYSLLMMDDVGEWREVAHRAVAVRENPPTMLLFAPHPNPFNGGTMIRFDLPGAGPVRLAVYDAAGRLARRLVDSDLLPGSHETVWDGRDAAGRSMASGSYFARLEAGGRVETVRMGLVR